MKIILLRILTGLFGIFFGCIAYLDLAEVDGHRYIIGLIVIMYLCLAMLNHARYVHRQKCLSKDPNMENKSDEVIRKTASFAVLGLGISFLGYATYSYFSYPAEVMTVTLSVIFSLVMVHYAVTGNRRPFIPK